MNCQDCPFLLTCAHSFSAIFPSHNTRLLFRLALMSAVPPPDQQEYALTAAINDSRFPPIARVELQHLSCKVRWAVGAGKGG